MIQKSSLVIFCSLKCFIVHLNMYLNSNVGLFLMFFFHLNLQILNHFDGKKEQYISVPNFNTQKQKKPQSGLTDTHTKKKLEK